MPKMEEKFLKIVPFAPQLCALPVHVLIFFHKDVFEILGVYSTFKNATQAMENLEKKHHPLTQCLFLITKEFDNI